MCHDPRWLGGRIGALAVLHTWTRMLEWHPHVHLLVPAGGVAADGRTLLTPRQRKRPFLVPVKVLSGVFRQRFLSSLAWRSARLCRTSHEATLGGILEAHGAGR